MNRITTAATLTLAAVVLWAGPASATKPVPGPDFEVTLPAGLACADFDLTIKGTGGSRVERVFTDQYGNVVRSISAGTGSALTYTNETTQASMSTRSNGAVSKTSFNADGTFTQVMTGHNVLILFPTDTPAGPSTTLHVGRIVIKVDPQDPNVPTTLLSARGKATDICAALS